MSHLILDNDDHYPGRDHYLGRVSQRASAALANIKVKFNTVGLRERAETYPFRQFLLATKLKFSRQIIHQYLGRLGPTIKLRCSF